MSFRILSNLVPPAIIVKGQWFEILPLWLSSGGDNPTRYRCQDRENKIPGNKYLLLFQSLLGKLLFNFAFSGSGNFCRCINYLPSFLQDSFFFCPVNTNSLLLDQSFNCNFNINVCFKLFADIKKRRRKLNTCLKEKVNLITSVNLINIL